MPITIRPGLLVNIASSVEGGVSYQRFDIKTGEKLEDGSTHSEWNTKKVVDDEVELKRAEQTRSKARSMIAKLCTKSKFGHICSPAKEAELDAAITEARKLCDEHNSDDQNKYTQIKIYVLKGRVESNDAEAMRSITSEITDLIAKMDAGIKEFDPEKIREAANNAREMSAMLGEEAQGKVNAAIQQARKAARTIVSRIQEKGEDKAVVLMDIQRGQIESARIAFLDMSENDAAPQDASPVIQSQRFADLDAEADAAPRAVGSEPVLKAVAAPILDMAV